MTILVTGGAGFIGANVVRRLLELGNEVCVLDDLSTGLRSNLSPGLGAFFRASIDDEVSVRKAMSSVTCVVHLGARGSVPRSIADPMRTHMVNATGTLNVLEAAREVGAQVVFSSSSSVYGANAQLPKTEDMWTSPLSPYAASKLSAEGYCAAYSASYGVPVTVFRFFNVFGPWQRPDHDYAAVIPRWVWAALAGQPIMLDGDGSQTRDFTYVDTVVDTIVDAVERRLDHPQPVNLAFGNRISLVTVIQELEELLGCNLEVQHQPPRAADVPHSQNDPTLLREVFPTIEPVPFPKALRATVEWMREHGPTVK